ncbi:hypothetical protein AY600_04930 [Phormidium willei BDU 130791]|nr:hypothetical protein AY600_04930 [Phormidium willei BDU 130791]
MAIANLMVSLPLGDQIADQIGNPTIASDWFCYENLKSVAKSGKVSENLAKRGDRVKSFPGMGTPNSLSTGSGVALKPPKTQKTRRTSGTSRLVAKRSF